MEQNARRADVLRAWVSIPRRIRRAIDGLTPRKLGVRVSADEWTIREYVHHLVEANLIASTIVIAALGKPGAVYDWSWVQPGGAWMKRLGYDGVAVEPALTLLEQLGRYLTLVVRSAPRGLSSPVSLRDSPADALERKTVEQVLREECEHAQHHLRDVARLRRAIT